MRSIIFEFFLRKTGISNEKGQGMVMEILVGVIMLSLVVVISSMAISKIMEDQCSKELEANVNSFARTVQQISKANLGNSKIAQLNIPSCFGGSERGLKFSNIKVDDICRSRCRSQAPCSVLEFKVADTTSTEYDEG
ncbi:MAG: hypothetical protein GOV15_02575, partial [Candidatus Diapherotrites archaeon]|nr:hypothetical protein [Candidatus Diapherotrites archaeon]